MTIKYFQNDTESSSRGGLAVIRYFLFLAALVHGLFLSPAYAAPSPGEDEFLEPDEAFRYSLEALEDGHILAKWTIAPGYYLYRSKFRFDSRDRHVTLGEAQLPPGTVKNDPFFGRMEVYYDQVDVQIPFSGTEDGSREVPFTVSYQGCAESGLCYPIQTRQSFLTLARLAPGPAAADTRPTTQTRTKPAIPQEPATGDDDFLEPDAAFQFSAEPLEDGHILAKWKVAPGYYLYRDKFKFDIEGDGVTLGYARFQPGKIKDDQFFGKVEVHHDQVEARIPFSGTGPGAKEATLIANFQGCAEAGLCYPPQKKSVSLSLPKVIATADAAETAAPTRVASLKQSEQDRIAGLVAERSTWFVLLAFFGFGLLLAFTPCVFPMIPILSSIIVGQGENVSTFKAFTLSTIYVLAMAVAYSAAGVIAGLFGSNIQAMFQEPWILTSFAAVFVALALSMFGFYEIQLPSFVQSKITQMSAGRSGGTYAGVAIMGLLSALIVGPCVAPPLAGALIYIGQSGDAVMGGLVLFSLSLGLGLPLIAVGTSLGKILPRAGKWMDAVKGVFGVLMLGVAIWILERIIPSFAAMLLWAALLVISAIYLGALEPIREGASGWFRLWKGSGILVMVYGIAVTVGAVSGGRDVLQPLGGIGAVAAGSQGSAELHFQRVKGLDEVRRQLEIAQASGKPVMLDFYADWCVACKELEIYTFSDSHVQQALGPALLLQADVTDWDEVDQALAREYGVIGPPAIIFFGPDGQEKREYRLAGFTGATEFEKHARLALQ